MSYWIFKVSEQRQYADVTGRSYVFDNTHSTHVSVGDEFVYLDKRKGRYELTGAGCVGHLDSRPPKPTERRNQRVRSIFTAHLVDISWFQPPVDISPRSRKGRQNRDLLGLPSDINAIGWSRSLPRVPQSLFQRLLDTAFDNDQGPAVELTESQWAVDGSLCLVRARRRMSIFRRIVLARHNHTCVVCGTTVRYALQAAHIQSYASDLGNRANPANGLCLCSFCHAAFDCGVVAILPDGKLRIAAGAMKDPIASMHFTSISPDQRRPWLAGVNTEFLRERASTTQSGV